MKMKNNETTNENLEEKNMIEYKAIQFRRKKKETKKKGVHNKNFFAYIKCLPMPSLEENRLLPTGGKYEKL
jgi:hypothetical protein